MQLGWAIHQPLLDGHVIFTSATIGDFWPVGHILQDSLIQR